MQHQSRSKLEAKGEAGAHGDPGDSSSAPAEHSSLSRLFCPGHGLWAGTTHIGGSSPEGGCLRCIIQSHQDYAPGSRGTGTNSND